MTAEMHLAMAEAYGTSDQLDAEWPGFVASLGRQVDLLLPELEQRLRPTSVMKDVAAMLRPFDYASRFALCGGQRRSCRRWSPWLWHGETATGGPS